MVTGNCIVSLIVIKNQLDVTSTYNERLHANKTVFIYLSFYQVQRWDAHTKKKLLRIMEKCVDVAVIKKCI